MTRSLLLVVLLGALPFYGPVTPSAPANGPPVVQTAVTCETAVTIFSPGRPTHVEARLLAPSRLAGEYYVGDGAGYNLHLDLKEGGNYKCTWKGCLGVYGTASGTWSINNVGLLLSAAKSEGMLRKRPLDRLRVVAFGGHYLLLQEDDRDSFEKWGPGPLCCFHKEGARKFLNDDFWRRVQERARQARER
jgi:hypothetical protein